MCKNVKECVFRTKNEAREVLAWLTEDVRHSNMKKQPEKGEYVLVGAFLRERDKDREMRYFYGHFGDTLVRCYYVEGSTMSKAHCEGCENYREEDCLTITFDAHGNECRVPGTYCACCIDENHPVNIHTLASCPML